VISQPTRVYRPVVESTLYHRPLAASPKSLDLGSYQAPNALKGRERRAVRVSEASMADLENGSSYDPKTGILHALG